MDVDAHRFRLSAMMFGQYFIMGCWIVTLGTYLMTPPTRGGLNFLPTYTGWIYSTMALAGIIAPIFVGLLADRLFSAEKLMGVLHLLSSLLIGAAAWICFERQPRIETAYVRAAEREQIDGIPVLEMERYLLASCEPLPETRQQIRESLQRVNDSPDVESLVRETFVPLFLLMFSYAFCNITAMTLSNVVAFRNLHDPKRTYSHVRLFGTVGWMVAGIQLALFWNTISAAPLFLVSGLSIAFGLFCFTLPNTPPASQAKSLSDALGLPALFMFRERSFCVLIICTLGIAAVQQFYGVYANRFLTELRTPYPAAVQTLAQAAEVLCMMACPFVLHRFGLKATMSLGLLGWILRNGIFATEAQPIIIAVGLPLHGLSYAFFVMVASMYVDRKAPLHLRASAQGIYTFVSLGAGTLFGNWLSGRVVQAFSEGDIVDWSRVWLVPTYISLSIFIAYLVLFRESEESSFLSRTDSRI